ncbi:MAG: hypothetical protein ACK51J_15490 [Burkholderiales bacterium]
MSSHELPDCWSWIRAGESTQKLIRAVRIRSVRDMDKRITMIHEPFVIQRDDSALLQIFQPAVAWDLRGNVGAPYVPNNLPH